MNSKDALELISAIKKSNYKPNDWEKEFLESVVKYSSLSHKQSKCLESIYAKAFDGGIYVKRQ